MAKVASVVLFEIFDEDASVGNRVDGAEQIPFVVKGAVR